MFSWSLDGEFSHLEKMISKPLPEEESNFKGQYHFGVIAVRRRDHEKWQQEEIPYSGSKKIEREKSRIPQKSLTFAQIILKTNE